MKKLFSILTVLLCVVLLMPSAFASDMDAASAYLNYLTKSKNISSMELTTLQKISLVSGDMALDLTTQNGTVKMIMPSANDFQMEMKITDSATNQTAFAYFKDNYLYEEIGVDKFKFKMDMNAAMTGAAGTDMSLTEDMLKDATIEIVPDGLKISYTMPPSAFTNDSVTAILKEMNLPDDVNMSFSGMTGSLTIGLDGTPKSMTSLIEMSVAQGEQTMKFMITQKTSIKSINSVDKINFPADLSEYKLLTV